MPPSLGPREVNPAVERCIERGLNYLAKNQRSDGSYDGYLGYASNRNVDPLPCAMTSMAGLALLASGSTPTRGPYAEQITKAADFVSIRCTTRPDGLITDPSDRLFRPMFGHAFATTFLSQVLGQVRDESRRERIRDVLRKGVAFTLSTQADVGAWNYGPADPMHYEGTLTVTQLQALRSCRDAGIFVPKRVIDNAVGYIESSTLPDGWVRYRLDNDIKRPGVTCAAVVALWSAGRYEDPLLKKIAARVRQDIRPGWRDQHHAEYITYYLSQARYFLGGDWPQFYQTCSTMLVSEQRSDGSWSGRDGGVTYGTAVALLVLHLPYNRLSIYQR